MLAHLTKLVCIVYAKHSKHVNASDQSKFYYTQARYLHKTSFLLPGTTNPHLPSKGGKGDKPFSLRVAPALSSPSQSTNKHNIIIIIIRPFRPPLQAQRFTEKGSLHPSPKVPKPLLS